jgi:hypothetical protein
MANPLSENQFDKIYWFIVGVCAAVLLFIVAVVFLHIPKENQRNADTAIAYLFGLMSGCAAYLVGSSPTTKKPENKTDNANS